MAVEAAAKLKSSRELDAYHPRPVNHPLFDKRLAARAGDEEIFISYLRVDKHWVLAEHRILENAALPGVAYLEIARAALAHLANEQNNEHMHGSMMEIRHLIMSQPLVVQNEEEKEVRTILEKQAEGFRFRVSSRRSPGKEQWQEHAAGTLIPLGAAPPVKHQIKEIEEQCGDNWITRVNADKASGPADHFIRVGPRWQNMKAGMAAGNRGLAQLELPAEFTGDLQSYRLHPALLDSATSFPVNQFQGDQIYLPFSFKKVRACIHGSLPGKIYSHTVYVNAEKQQPGSPQKTLEFNVAIMDELGTELMIIEGFTLLALSPDRSPLSAPLPQEKQQEPNPLENGIRPAEGIEVFRRILAHRCPQVLVSTVDFHRLLDKTGEFQLLRLQEDAAAGTAPAAAQPRPSLSTAYAAPTNTTQQTLVRIWQEFFGIQQPGIHDDFFELGGDSLKALTLLTRVHKEFNVEIPVTDIFNSPTIQGISRIIHRTGKSRYAAIKSIEQREYYPLSSAQKRMYFLQQVQKENIFYNLPQFMILEGLLDRSRLAKAFKRLLHRHESLRTSYQLVKGEAVQRINKTGTIDGRIIYTEAQEHQLHDMAQQFVRPFDMTRAPLLRMQVAQFHPGKYFWLFDIHHIVTDATGGAILIKDLIKLYHNEELTPLPIQYKDFSLWQKQWLESGKIKQQEDYWLKVYADAPHIPRLNLPLDYPRPQQLSFAGSTHTFKLRGEEKSAFMELGSRAGATFFINLLAVFNILLYKYTGQEDIIIGSSIAGRSHADLRQILGMFVNLLALRNHIHEQMTYREFLQNVKQNTLEAFENQDVQFEILVEKLKPDTHTTSAGNPLFDVCINVENYEQPGFESHQLNVSPFHGYQATTTRFDILLWAYEGGEEIRFILEYSTELFKPATMETFAHRLMEIIRQVSKNNDIQLKDIKVSQQLKGSRVNVPPIEFGF